jgi:hypothetical protein
VLALGLVLLAIFNLPEGDCYGVEDDDGSAEILLLIVTPAASLACLAAGALRSASLARAGGDLHRQLRVVGVGSLVALVATGAIASDGNGLQYLGVLCAVGTAATAVALLVLIIAWLAGRGPDDVGLLLPVYLFGAGLFVYPLFAWMGLLLSSGGFC